MSTTVRAAAKINLHLGVGGPREDGFHPLDTVYQAISLYDDVTVSPAEEDSISVRGAAQVDLREVPTDRSNIALRALAEAPCGAGHRVRIEKDIPVAGGMAGGSADGAAALLAHDRLHGLAQPDAVLLEQAARLGSDVPFSLVGGTARGRGRGELVESIDDAGHVVVGRRPLRRRALHPRGLPPLRPTLPRGATGARRTDRAAGGPREPGNRTSRPRPPQRPPGTGDRPASRARRPHRRR